MARWPKTLIGPKASRTPPNHPSRIILQKATAKPTSLMTEGE